MPINPEILTEWESLEKICGVPDIMSDRTTVLFILESPHIEEVRAKIPAVGRSGREMTKVLFNGRIHEPMGEYLSVHNGHVGLCNVSSLPLQEKAYHRLCKHEHAGLTNALAAVRNNWNKRGNFTPILQQVEDVMFAKFMQKIVHCSSAQVLIPCGKFAQYYTRKASNVFKGKEVVWDIPHPSHSWWDIKREHVLGKVSKYFNHSSLDVVRLLEQFKADNTLQVDK